MPRNVSLIDTLPKELPASGTWPHQRVARWVFWSGVVGLPLLALGITQSHLQTQHATTTALEKTLALRSAQRLQELVSLAQETVLLSETADTTNLEAHLSNALAHQQEQSGDREPALQAELHRQLALLAAQRSDVVPALAELNKAAELAATEEFRVALELDRLEIYLAAEQAVPLAQSAVSEVTARVGRLPDGPVKATAALRLGVIQAEISSAAAEAATEEDQLQRELMVGQFKSKILALSMQREAERNVQFQKREQALQEATTRNDPAQMAQAIKEKEQFEEKFSGEFKQREDELQKEAKTALQPNPQITALQAAAVQAWQQLSIPADVPELTCRIQRGLAAALLQQQNFPGAITALAPALAEKTAAALDRIRALHLSARIEQAQATRLAGPAATAVLQQALSAATQSHDLLSKLPLHRPALLRQASAVEFTLAGLHASLGQKESAQQFQSAAEQHLQASAQDHHWREILAQAQARVQQLRQSLRQKYQPAIQDQLTAAQQLLAALKQWQADYLTNVPSPAEARAAAIIATAPEQYPWASLLKMIK